MISKFFRRNFELVHAEHALDKKNSLWFVLNPFASVQNDLCSTSEKPTHLFRTKAPPLSQLLPGANKVVNALRFADQGLY